MLINLKVVLNLNAYNYLQILNSYDVAGLWQVLWEQWRIGSARQELSQRKLYAHLPGTVLSINKKGGIEG